MIQVCAHFPRLTHLQNYTGSDNEEEREYPSPPSLSSSISSSSDEDLHPIAVIHTAANSSDAEDIHGLPYVQLDSDYTNSLCWSNDPGQLSLQTYFDPDKPNLSSDFNVPGLSPILREYGGRHRFILKGSKGRFYVWNEWSGRLFWVRHKEIEELDSLEDKVNFVLCRLGGLEVEPVFHTYHPADDPKLPEMRETLPKHRI